MSLLKTLGMIAALVAGLLAGAPAGAGEVSVQARVDRIRVADGEPVRLSITVKGGPGTVDLSALKDFTVQSRSSSTNIQIVNGSFSKEIRYDYGLVPKRTGRLTIPALPVKTDEGMRHTAPIDIVVAASPQPASGEAPDIFVEADVTRAEPVAGEQMVYRFRFFNAVQIADNARFQPPDFKGFSAQKVKKEKVFEKVVNGRTYQVTEIAFVLTPLESGEAVIDPAMIQCEVFRKGEDRDPMSRFSPFFNDRFFSRYRAVTRTFRTRPIPVTVKPLPPVPSGMKFSGLVGTFDVGAETDKTAVKAGDSVTLTVTVTGQGNVMDAPAPDLSALSGAKVYADTPEDETTVTDKGVSGKKRFRFALVPIHPGQLKIPPMGLGIFDPSRGRYRHIASPPLSLRVDPGTDHETVPPVQAESTPRAVGKKPVTFSGRDILPLKESLKAVDDRPAMAPLVFIGGLAAPALLYLLTVTLLAALKQPHEIGRKMARQARAQLRLAAAARPRSDAEFLTALYNALVSAVLSVAGRTGGAPTAAEVQRFLGEAGKKDSDIQTVIDLFQRIEAARFGGGHIEADTGAVLMEKTRRQVRGLCR